MRRSLTTLLLLATAAALASAPEAAPGGDRPADAGPSRALPTVAEARGRAALLHESIHATLHYVHREYFSEVDGTTIPATTLKAVFRELADRQGVQVHWLAVNAQAMNVDHKPRDDFEREAVKALTDGAESHERAQGGTYRRVGTITLSSECLRCHLPSRSSNKDRAAGLVIEMKTRD